MNKLSKDISKTKFILFRSANKETKSVTLQFK